RSRPALDEFYFDLRKIQFNVFFTAIFEIDIESVSAVGVLISMVIFTISLGVGPQIKPCTAETMTSRYKPAWCIWAIRYKEGRIYSRQPRAL
uniref:Uncharacterized protein n=1 Tax=Anopheles albimanus TaxID=7167 RepID=A0A182FZJ7_ANOAL